MSASQPVAERTSPGSLGNAAASGVAWALVLNLGGRFAIIGSQLVLAKLLAPEDFGIVGLANTITIIVGALTSFGIEDVFQQRRAKMKLWATQAFWLSLGLASFAAAVMAVVAYFAAKAYHNAEVATLVWIVAVSLPITALSTVPQARLKSQLRFKFLAVYSSAEVLAMQCLIVAFALYGLKAISFVLPFPLLAIVRAFVMWREAPLPLRSFRASKGWRRMMTRGASAFGVSLLGASINQGGYVMLGLLTTAHVVGVYFFAFRLVAQPMLLLAINFNNVLRPTLIALNGDPARQSEIALKTGRLLGLLTVPLCLLQAAVAAPALQLLIGPRWNEAIPLILILSIGVPLDAVAWTAASLLEARGKFSTSFRYQLISAPFFFVFTGVGALLADALGVAIGAAAYYVLHPIYLTLMVFTKDGVAAKRVLACFYMPLLLTAPTIGSAYIISQASVFQHAPLMQILLVLGLGGFAYILAVRQLMPDVYADFYIRLVRVTGWKRSAPDSVSEPI